MTKPKTFKELIEIMGLFDGFTGPDSDSLWWRTDDEYAPITLMVNCNDLFFWGCADCERIGPEDVADFKIAQKDIEDEDGCSYNAHFLWIARKRKQRPQLAYYKHFSARERALFDECGAEEDQYGTAAYFEKRKA